MKVLVLGGGNTKGSFQAGVIHSLYETGYRPDKIIGTSIGAINAWILSRTDHNFLYSFWHNIGPRSRYLRYNWRNMFLDGIFDMVPMGKVLSSVNTEQHTKAYYCICNLGTEQTILTESLEGCLASGSEPLFMRPINGWMDGGIRDQVPIKQALEFCEEKNITAIVNNPVTPKLGDGRFPKTWLGIVLKSVDIQTRESFINDMYKFEGDLYAPDIVPMTRFTFDKEPVRKALMYGQEIGKRGPVQRS